MNNPFERSYLSEASNDSNDKAMVEDEYKSTENKESSIGPCGQACKSYVIYGTCHACINEIK